MYNKIKMNTVHFDNKADIPKAFGINAYKDRRVSSHFHLFLLKNVCAGIWARRDAIKSRRYQAGA